MRETGRDWAESTGDVRGNSRERPAGDGHSAVPSGLLRCIDRRCGDGLHRCANSERLFKGSQLSKLLALTTSEVALSSESVLSVLNPSAEVLTRDIRTESGR